MDYKLGEAFSQGRLSEHVELSSFAAKELLQEFNLDVGVREMSFNEALIYAQKKFEEKLDILSLDICKEQLEDDIRVIREVISMVNKSS